MIHLIYISSATHWLSEQELLELLTKARRKNQQKNITGMLLYDNATFLQVLEGEADSVHEIFSAINDDSRNTGIVKLVEEDIQQRDFPDWSMGFKDLKSIPPESMPGFVDIFNGQLDKEIASNNKLGAIKLLMNFANRDN